MLKVTVEVHPYGDKTKAKTIETLYLANEGVADTCGADTVCSYAVWRNKDPRQKPKPRAHAHTIHERDDGALMLIAAAILDLLGYDYSIKKRGS